MVLLPMPIQRSLGVEHFRTALLRAWVRTQALVLLPNVSAQRLLLPEALPAVLAAEPVGAFVYRLMPLQSSSRDEALAAALAGADMVALVCVYGLDMLL